MSTPDKFELPISPLSDESLNTKDKLLQSLAWNEESTQEKGERAIRQGVTNQANTQLKEAPQAVRNAFIYQEVKKHLDIELTDLKSAGTNPITLAHLEGWKAFNSKDSVSALGRKLITAQTILDNKLSTDEAKAVLTAKASGNDFADWTKNILDKDGKIQQDVLASKIATLREIYTSPIAHGKPVDSTDVVNTNFLNLVEKSLSNRTSPLENECGKAIVYYIHNAKSLTHLTNAAQTENEKVSKVREGLVQITAGQLQQATNQPVDANTVQEIKRIIDLNTFSTATVNDNSSAIATDSISAVSQIYTDAIIGRQAALAMQTTSPAEIQFASLNALASAQNTGTELAVQNSVPPPPPPHEPGVFDPSKIEQRSVTPRGGLSFPLEQTTPQLGNPFQAAMYDANMAALTGRYGQMYNPYATMAGYRGPGYPFGVNNMGYSYANPYMNPYGMALGNSYMNPYMNPMNPYMNPYAMNGFGGGLGGGGLGGLVGYELGSMLGRGSANPYMNPYMNSYMNPYLNPYMSSYNMGGMGYPNPYMNPYMNPYGTGGYGGYGGYGGGGCGGLGMGGLGMGGLGMGGMGGMMGMGGMGLLYMLPYLLSANQFGSGGGLGNGFGNINNPNAGRYATHGNPYGLPIANNPNQIIDNQALNGNQGQLANLNPLQQQHLQQLEQLRQQHQQRLQQLEQQHQQQLQQWQQQHQQPHPQPVHPQPHQPNNHSVGPRPQPLPRPNNGSRPNNGAHPQPFNPFRPNGGGNGGGIRPHNGGGRPHRASSEGLPRSTNRNYYASGMSNFLASGSGLALLTGFTPSWDCGFLNPIRLRDTNSLMGMRTNNTNFIF